MHAIIKWLQGIYYRHYVYKICTRPDDFRFVKKGDVLVRVMPGFTPENRWYNKAVVREVTHDKIVCDVFVDTTRCMEFHRITGISLQKAFANQHLEFPLTSEAKAAI